MSRYYGMRVEIVGHDDARSEEVKAAAGQEWPFDDWMNFQPPGSNDLAISAYAEDNLYGGESEEQFTERLSLAIWRANGAYCEVTVDATYLESLPYETHTLDQADYARLIGEQEEPHNANGPGR